MDTTSRPLVLPGGNLRIRIAPAPEGGYLLELVPAQSPTLLLPDDDPGDVDDGTPPERTRKPQPPRRPLPRPEVVTPQTVIAAVARFYGLSIKRLVGSSRCQGVARPRAVAMYLVRHLTRSSYPEIGAAFGHRHHTTAIAAVHRVEAALDGDPVPGMEPEVVAHVRALRAQLQPAAVPLPSATVAVATAPFVEATP